MNVAPVKNASVWGSLRTLFMGSMVIFLINIYFGFDNSLTIGEIPRWQVLIHLHGGSIGWITLSAIGIAVWLLTGQRDVTPAYEGRVRTLTWAAIVIFAGYVVAFGLAFSRPSGFLVTLHPIFGAGAVLVLWYAAIFALSQLRNQPVTTTVHLLAASALLVAAIGATVGMLLGLERAIGRFLPLPELDRVGAHAGMMDTYLFLIASAVIEWITLGDTGKRWTVFGLIQAVAWVIAAALVPIAYFLNMLDQILPVFGLLLLVALIVFLARTAWRTIRTGPAGSPARSWTFFGTLWFLVYIGFFFYVIGTGADFTALPAWFGAVFAHTAFVGMMTNLILGVLSTRTQDARSVVAWGETAALWTINGGMVVFFALKIASDVRLGAIVMGVGVVLGIFTMFMRLRASGSIAATGAA